EEGSRVRAGQVLARLDGDRLRLEAAQAEANLRKTEKDYARNLELQKRGLVSSTAFDGLKYDLEALRASYDMARLNLSYTEIRAPIDGIVAERKIKVGNMLTVNQELFHITDPDPLLVYVHVPEREMRKLSPGQLADIEVDAVPGTRFTGRIALISPVVDPATATFKAKLEVKDDSGRLLPGMFARVNIVYERREGALQVPRSALVEGDGQPSVFVVVKGKAEQRKVTTGLANGGLIEVTAGLTAGEQVIVVGQGALKQGTAVRIVGSTPAAVKPAAVAR
nr:efflux RND transporter periplasmic adaptor subunit [Steroidobacteraceae bacterium]